MTSRFARRSTRAPPAVRSELEALADDYGATELLVLTVTHDHAVRRRSYELLADAFSLAVTASTRDAA